MDHEVTLRVEVKRDEAERRSLMTSWNLKASSELRVSCLLLAKRIQNRAGAHFSINNNCVITFVIRNIMHVS